MRYGNDTVVSRSVWLILGIMWPATPVLINTRLLFWPVIISLLNFSGTMPPKSRQYWRKNYCIWESRQDGVHCPGYEAFLIKVSVFFSLGPALEMRNPHVIFEALHVFSSEFCHQLLILTLKHSGLQPAFYPHRFLLPCRLLFLHNLQLEISKIMVCFSIDIMTRIETGFIYLLRPII